MIAEGYGRLDVVSLNGLRRHFNDRTKRGGDMEIPPNGVVWTVMSPFPRIADALARAVKSRQHHIGVLMPQSDEVLRPGVVGAYEPDITDRTGGSIRRMRFTITLFIRSLKMQVTDGLIAVFPSWLEELTRSYPDNDTVRVDTVRFMGLEPDYLVVEAMAHLDYVSLTHKLDFPKLMKVIVEGPDNDNDGQNDMWFEVQT